jgi:hypothetical protein
MEEGKRGGRGGREGSKEGGRKEKEERKGGRWSLEVGRRGKDKPWIGCNQYGLPV